MRRKILITITLLFSIISGFHWQSGRSIPDAILTIIFYPLILGCLASFISIRQKLILKHTIPLFLIIITTVSRSVYYTIDAGYNYVLKDPETQIFTILSFFGEMFFIYLSYLTLYVFLKFKKGGTA